jgi:UPF0716 family protein affecting phage T7 exclusion
MRSLAQWKRNLIGVLTVLVGIVLMFCLCGTDAAGLLLLLPFAAFAVWLCPELWRGA